jgi:hypothetical protein
VIETVVVQFSNDPVTVPLAPLGLADHVIESALYDVPLITIEPEVVTVLV